MNMKMRMENETLAEWNELLALYRQKGSRGVPTPLRRPKGKQTRYFVDNEFLEGGYAARFRKYHILPVYAVLCRHAKADAQTCFPSYKQVMKLTGLTNRNRVSLALRILEALNIIFIEHSAGRQSNRYLLLRTELWKSPDSITVDTNGRRNDNQTATVSEKTGTVSEDVEQSHGRYTKSYKYPSHRIIEVK